MADDQKPVSVNFSIDPNQTRVLYTDSYLISHGEHAVVFSFAQAMPDPSQHTIVSRIAMTKSQAKEFLKTLNDHIEKFEV